MPTHLDLSARCRAAAPGSVIVLWRHSGADDREHEHNLLALAREHGVTPGGSARIGDQAWKLVVTGEKTGGFALLVPDAHPRPPALPNVDHNVPSTTTRTTPQKDFRAWWREGLAARGIPLRRTGERATATQYTGENNLE